MRIKTIQKYDDWGNSNKNINLFNNVPIIPCLLERNDKSDLFIYLYIYIYMYKYTRIYKIYVLFFMYH